MATIQHATRAYQQSFDSRPYTTLAITNGFLSAVGDYVAQVAQILGTKPTNHEDVPRYDIQRTLRFFTFGFAMGPVIGRWNKFLETRFPLRVPTTQSFSPLSGGVQFGRTAPAAPLYSPIGQMPRTSGVAVAKRVAADQLIMAPIGLALFIGSMGTLEGQDLPHIKRKFKDMYSSTLMANWQVWPLAQIVNFRYMPLPARVPFQATCGIFWNLYLSLLNSRENREVRREDALQQTTG